MVTNQCDKLVTLVLACVFVSLGSLRVLLIKFSENDSGHYDYVPVSVNVCSEFVKLVICFSLSLRVFIQDYKTKRRGFLCADKYEVLEFVKWSIPGLLYFIDNLIAFYTLEYFQPALVVLLGNFYIITTSLLYRLILKRVFSRVQWISVFILFMAIMLLSLQSTPSGVVHVDHHKSHHAIAAITARSPFIAHNNPDNSSTGLPVVSPQSSLLCPADDTPTKPSATNATVAVIVPATDIGGTTRFKFNFHEGHILVLFQCLIASTANVYNEKIFKENNGQESLYVQNSKLYLFGLLFNAVTVFVHGGYRQRVLDCGFFYGHNYFSLCLVLVTAFYGLTVALIFKFKDNMFHVLSTQITTVLVVSASMYYFAFKPSLEFFLAAPIVLAAIYLFNISKAKTSQEVPDFEGRLGAGGAGGREDLVYHDEHRPLVAVLDQNED